jgi:hypothetical protein
MRKTFALAILLGACRNGQSDRIDASRDPSAGLGSNTPTSASAARSARRPVTTIPPFDVLFIDAVVATDDGGVVFSGVVGDEGKIDGSPVRSATGRGADGTAFLAAIRDGRVSWVKTLGRGRKGASRLARGPNGDVWSVMSFQHPITLGGRTFTPRSAPDLLDPDSAPQPTNDLLVWRIGRDGAPAWAEAIASEGDDFCGGLAVTSDGPRVAALVPLAAPPYARAPSAAPLLVSFATSGGVERPKIGSVAISGIGVPTRLIADRGGNTVVAGMGPGTQDVVARMTSDGRPTWQKPFDGRVFAIAATPNDTVLVVHGTRSQAAPPNLEVRATELSPDGAAVATHSLTSSLRVAGVVFAASGDALVIGTTEETMGRGHPTVETRSSKLELRASRRIEATEGSVTAFAAADGGAWLAMEIATPAGTRGALRFASAE